MIIFFYSGAKHCVYNLIHKSKDKDMSNQNGKKNIKTDVFK